VAAEVEVVEMMVTLNPAEAEVEAHSPGAVIPQNPCLVL
jgi:hypothetical protein